MFGCSQAMQILCISILSSSRDQNFSADMRLLCLRLAVDMSLLLSRTLEKIRVSKYGRRKHILSVFCQQTQPGAQRMYFVSEPVIVHLVCNSLHGSPKSGSTNTQILAAWCNLKASIQLQ